MISIIDVEASGEYILGDSKKRYEMLKEAVELGMTKADAVNLYSRLHLPDEQHEEYLNKLKEY